MTGMTRRARRRQVMLAGVTLVMVMSLMSGCGSAESRATKRAGATTSPPRRALEPQFDDRPTTRPAAAPTINVFGEIDDQPGSVPAPTTEAGFQQHTFVDEGHDGDVAV